jgi:putative ABC transport system substrate-binding protein
MRRRNFIAAVSTLAAIGAEAQVPSPRRLIAYLSAVQRERSLREIDAFLSGLRELGHVESRDFDIAYRFADGFLDRLETLAQELIRLEPKVILATVTPGVVALRALTQTLPIVCPLLADPVRFGLIDTLSRPGGSVTGVLFRIDDLAGKQLELARELMPDATRVGLVVNVATGVVIDRDVAEKAAGKLGVTLVPAEVRAPGDIEPAFQRLASDHVQAIVVLVDGLFFNERQRIAALAAAAQLPTVYGFRDHVDAGGLISYGVNLAANFHRSASYVARILSGAKPGDLPVEFPTKIELVVNLKAAKALNLAIPASVLARADDVIE